MFLDNKYAKWYYIIIDAAKERMINDEYYEKHHIIPKSLGGSNDSSNLVHLTAREHFLCHWLLTKMCEGEAKKKMHFALKRCSDSKNGKIISSWQYEIARKAQSKARKNSITSDETRSKISKSMTGKKFGPISESRRIKLRNSQLLRNSASRIHSAETKEKMRKPKISTINMKKPKNTSKCPHCGIEGGAGALTRYHFDNCKEIRHA